MGLNMESDLDGLQEPARGRGLAKNTDWEQAGQDRAGRGRAFISFLSLPWGFLGPPSTPISISSSRHLAAITGGADCRAPLATPLPRKQAQLGPCHICRISTEHSWACPEPRSPKHKGGRGPRRARTPERDTLTPLPTDTHSSRRSYTHHHTRSLVRRDRTDKHEITPSRPPPPLPSPRPLFLLLSPPGSPPPATMATSGLPWTLWREQGSHPPQVHPSGRLGGQEGWGSQGASGPSRRLEKPPAMPIPLATKKPHLQHWSSPPCSRWGLHPRVGWLGPWTVVTRDTGFHSPPQGGAACPQSLNRSSAAPRAPATYPTPNNRPAPYPQQCTHPLSSATPDCRGSLVMKENPLLRRDKQGTLLSSLFPRR